MYRGCELFCFIVELHNITGDLLPEG